jgi:hypothetical protein
VRKQDKEKLRISREQREKLLEEALMSPSGLKRLAQQMANPIRHALDYKSITRRFVTVRKIYTKIVGKTFRCAKPNKNQLDIDTIKVIHRHSWKERNSFPAQRPMPEYDVEVTTKTGKTYYDGISYVKLRGKNSRFRMVRDDAFDKDIK